jgi:hypothetical protein
VQFMNGIPKRIDILDKLLVEELAILEGQKKK